MYASVSGVFFTHYNDFEIQIAACVIILFIFTDNYSMDTPHFGCLFTC